MEQNWQTDRSNGDLVDSGYTRRHFCLDTPRIYLPQWTGRGGSFLEIQKRQQHSLNIYECQSLKTIWFGDLKPGNNPFATISPAVGGGYCQHVTLCAKCSSCFISLKPPGNSKGHGQYYRHFSDSGAEARSPALKPPAMSLLFLIKAQLQRWVRGLRTLLCS